MVFVTDVPVLTKKNEPLEDLSTRIEFTDIRSWNRTDPLNSIFR